MTAAEDALLAQILTEVRATRATVSGIQVDMARAVAEIEHRATQAEDHEDRIRKLEAVEAVTPDDLAASQDRRQAKQRAWMAMALTVFGFVETAVIAWLVRG